MKLNKKIIIILVIIFVILFTLIKVIKIQDYILKHLYPQKYTEQVEKYAEEYKVDKNYIYAIIKAESNFEENAKSNSGAKGLMQIMDNTAKDVAISLGMEYQEYYELYNSDINIMFGTKYFSMLLKDYNNNVNLALAAYNAGKGNVKKWIDNGILSADGENIENIPFKETNMYVRKILQNYKIYNKLYK